MSRDCIPPGVMWYEAHSTTDEGFLQKKIIEPKSNKACRVKYHLQETQRRWRNKQTPQGYKYEFGTFYMRLTVSTICQWLA